MNFKDIIRATEEKKSTMQRLEVELERVFDTTSVGVKIDKQKILVKSSPECTQMFEQLLNLCGDILAENNPFFRHFRLCHNFSLSEDEVSFARLIQGLQRNTTLKSLRIHGVGEGVVEGVAALLGTGVLEHLELHESVMSETNCSTFFDALRHNNHLKQLSLARCEFCFDTFSLLGEALKTNRVLRELTIMSFLTDESVVDLTNGIACNSGLEVLDLSYCEGFEQTENSQALGNALASRPAIKAVHLRSCEITGELFEVGLSNNTTLEFLNLAESNFSVEELVKALEKMTQSVRKRSLDGLSKQQLALEELDLFDSTVTFTPRALCSLLECLVRNPEIPIKKLHLGNGEEIEEARNVFLGRFMEVLCQLVRSTKTLQEISFNTCAFEDCNDDKYLALNKAMECNNTITYLSSCFDYPACNRDVSDTNWMRVLYYTRRNKYRVEILEEETLGLFPLVCVALTQRCLQSSAMGESSKRRESEVEGKLPSVMTSLVFELLRSSPTIFSGIRK